MKQENEIIQFENIGLFESWLREEMTAPDYVKIGDLVFTLDNYDIDGKEMTYGNKRTFKSFSVFNEDRYGLNGLSDSEVSEIEESCIRNDINYLD
jgi:hypothetical protein